MTVSVQPPLVCYNGHPSPTPDASFCFECGARLGTMTGTINQSAITHQAPHQAPHQSPPALPIQQQRHPGSLPTPPPHHGLPAPPQAQQAMVPAVPVNQCRRCGGQGQWLERHIVRCQECSWLRPLAPGYTLDCAAFQWSEDGKAMSVLRSIKPLNAIGRAISDKIGRRWVETAFNGVLLSEKQLPDVYAQAVLAARIMGMQYMPDVYVSGERMWDCLTYGSDKSAFILIGTALATNFRGPELLFLLAREMGHCRAGHALWKTVIRFLLGEQGPRKGLMSNGLLSALNPTALIEGALEMPLLAWARQAEITADRAGLLAIGDEEIARRVLLSWSLKSSFLYKQINIASWLEQQAASDDELTKLSELTTSSTPYITRRLKFLTDFARSAELQKWRAVIGNLAQIEPISFNNFPPAQSSTQVPTNPIVAGRNHAAGAPTTPAASGSASPPKPKTGGDLRMKCSACQKPLRVPASIFAGKQQINIKCPDAACGKVTVLKKKSAPPPPTVKDTRDDEARQQSERTLSDGSE